MELSKEFEEFIKKIKVKLGFLPHDFIETLQNIKQYLLEREKKE